MSTKKVLLVAAVALWGSTAPLVAEAPNVPPPPNVNSQQTAYYDFEGGPQVVRTKYKPASLAQLPIQEDLWECPALITDTQRCVFHNSAEITNRLEGRYEIN